MLVVSENYQNDQNRAVSQQKSDVKRRVGGRGGGESESVEWIHGYSKVYAHHVVVY